MLWWAREHIPAKAENHETPFVQSLTFYYEAYNVDKAGGSKWFCLWDVWDMLRKLFLTSVILFIGEESFTQLTVGVGFAVMALCMHLQFRPFDPDDRIGHYLQVVSLSSIAGVLLIGVGLRGQQATEGSEAKSVDSYGLGVLLIAVSVLTLIGVVGVALWHAYNNWTDIKQWFRDLCSRLRQCRCCRSPVVGDVPPGSQEQGMKQGKHGKDRKEGRKQSQPTAIINYNPTYDSSSVEEPQVVSQYMEVVSNTDEEFGWN